MELSTKYKDEVRKEYIREEKKSVRPGSHSKDSEVNWEKSENLHKKKSSFPPCEVSDGIGVCENETDISTCSPTHAREKNHSKGLMPQNFSKRSSHVKMKSPRRSTVKVT